MVAYNLEDVPGNNLRNTIARQHNEKSTTYVAQLAPDASQRSNNE